MSPGEIFRCPGATVVTCLALLILPGTGSLWAQEFRLSLTSARVVPGSQFSLDLLGTLSQPIRGYQVGIEFPPQAMELLQFTLRGSVLEDQAPAVMERFVRFDHGTVKVLLDDVPPFEDSISAGESVSLGRFHFHMFQGFDSGQEFTVSLSSGVGSPPLEALIHAGSSSFPPDNLSPGVVRVTELNTLRIADNDSVRRNSLETVEFFAFNVSPMQGFSLGVQFDPSVVRFLGVDVTDTITEAVGVEYVAPVIDNTVGFFLLGVLLDSVPPFQNQLIPASGLDLLIAKADVEILDAPPGTSSFDLVLVDGLGSPPINNLFVINNMSVPPEKLNGRFSFIREGLFVRGNVNGDRFLDVSDPISAVIWIFLAGPPPDCQKTGDADDNGMVDINDIVYSLRYQFQGGPIIPQPFPEPGFDPTPDDLPCPEG